MNFTGANVILINGTSCAGKSSVAKYLCDSLTDNYEYIAWDDYVESIIQDEALSNDQKKDLLGMFLEDTTDKLKAGSKLILDVVCVSTKTLNDLLNHYEHYGLLTVYMEAPVDVLNARERERPNRTNGQAQEQYFQIRDEENHPPYDMNFDSSLLSIGSIGDTIATKVEQMNAEAASTQKSRNKPEQFKF